MKHHKRYADDVVALAAEVIRLQNEIVYLNELIDELRMSDE